MSEVLIKAENVSKKFCRSLKHTMLYGMSDLTRSFFGADQKNNELRQNEFWAVDNVSFELKKGDCLGIIGSNGSGKSTLLKMLNGIFMPDTGKIEINGRVGALIEVGAGFHPMLTGRENVYINGSILGFSKREIDSKFDEIVEFAELEEFIDAPVKHYSSGMYVRLGFAIAAQMEPDILLIDEVLAVGDVGFRAKCFNEIGKISKKAAIILVSHSMPQVARVSTGICALNKGTIQYHGTDVPKGIDHYYSQFKAQKGVVTGSGRAAIHKIELEANGKKNVEVINYGDNLLLHLTASVHEKIKNPIINISFLSRELQIVAQCNSFYNGIVLKNSGKLLQITVNIPEIVLNSGIYSVSVFITDETQNEMCVQHYAVKELKVVSSFVGLAPVQFGGEWVQDEGC